MADTHISYDIIRMDVRNPEKTEVCVFITNLSRDGLFGVHGWHHKSFPPDITTTQIMQAWSSGEENPLLWPLVETLSDELLDERVQQIRAAMETFYAELRARQNYNVAASKALEAIQDALGMRFDPLG